MSKNGVDVAKQEKKAAVPTAVAAGGTTAVARKNGGGAAAAGKGGLAAGKGKQAPGGISEERKRLVRELLRKKEEEVKTMLAPEKEMSDIDVLAKKIVAEVTALEAKGGDDGAENSEFTYLAAVESAPQFHCPVCGNRNQTNFMLDAKQGDTICLGADGHGCGTVVQDHKVHEGSMYRKFEGEADRSHHGPAPNRLYSTAHNMRTWISEGKDASRLRTLAEDVEMGLSNVGKEERKTRTAYKDQMKREAFDLVNHISGNLDLHETVVVRAKELFAGWRNAKEHVNQRDAVICACIVAAYREVSTEELSRQIDLKERRRHFPGAGVGEEDGEGADDDKEDPLYPFECAQCKSRFNAAKALFMHQRERHKSAKVEGADVGGAGPSKMMSDWSVAEARTWLTNVLAALQLPAEHVQSICASLEQSLRAQEAGQRVGVKRKAPKTAGQLLSLLTLNRLTELCGGGAEGAAAGAKLHQETSRKRGERARKDRDRVASYNAAQRNHQNVRKPWVAHIRDELNGTAVAPASKGATTATVTPTSTTANSTAEGQTITPAATDAAAAAAAPGAAVEKGTTTGGTPGAQAIPGGVQSGAVDGLNAGGKIAEAIAPAAVPSAGAADGAGVALAGVHQGGPSSTGLQAAGSGVGDGGPPVTA